MDAKWFLQQQLQKEAGDFAIFMRFWRAWWVRESETCEQRLVSIVWTSLVKLDRSIGDWKLISSWSHHLLWSTVIQHCCNSWRQLGWREISPVCRTWPRTKCAFFYLQRHWRRRQRDSWDWMVGMKGVGIIMRTNYRHLVELFDGSEFHCQVCEWAKAYRLWDATREPFSRITTRGVVDSSSR